MRNVSLDDLRCGHNVLHIRMSLQLLLHVHILLIVGGAFEINPTMCLQMIIVMQ